MEGSVDSVQELWANGCDPPSRYIVKGEIGPINISSLPPSSPIPVIDLSRLFQPDGADELAKLRSALESWGLFIAVGHGISSDLLDEVLNMSREFFQQPLEEKQKYKSMSDEKNMVMEGYGNDGVESDDVALDWSDRLQLVVQPEDQRTLSLWPSTPSSFRHTLHEFGTKSANVRDMVLRAMAKSLDLKEDTFVNKFDEKASIYARFNYYPPCTRPDLVLGCGAHSDGSVLTILLLEKDVRGLQVYKDGNWVDVFTTLPSSLLVNLGDGMEIMSNGIFTSAVHRVFTNSAKGRLSVVEFCGLDLEKELEPADGLIDEKRPRIFKTVKTKDYLDRQNYGESKKALYSFKVEA
ncbi:hypothetical protein LUZ60_006601 [Juncus effusus]|nr:hypothetical protein LUZ60_006601 [Juncus effusus]